MMLETSPPSPVKPPAIAAQNPGGRFIVPLLGSLTILNPLSIDMYLPSFPDLQRAFGVGYTQIELSLSAFFVGMILGQLFCGPLTDIFGRRKPLLFGLTLFCVSSLGCAVAPGIRTFIACRVLQALGGCAGIVTSRAIVRDLFEKQRAAQVFSLLMLMTGLGPILGPSLGGLIIRQFGWRAIFWLLSCLGVFSGLCAWLFLPETLRGTKLGLSWHKMLGSYAMLCKDRRFLAFALSGSAISAGMFAYITGSAFVFIDLLHIPPRHYGCLFGVNAFGMIAAAQVNRYLVMTYSLEAILRQVTWAAALFGVGLWVSVQTFHALWFTIAPLFAFLALLGFMLPNCAAGAISHQPCSRAGTAAALQGVLQGVGALLASLAVSQMHDGTSRPMATVIAVAGLASLGLFRVLLPRGAERSFQTGVNLRG